MATRNEEMTAPGLRRDRQLLNGVLLSRFAILCLAVWLHAASSMLAATTLPSAIAELGGAHLVGWAFMLYQLGSILAGAVSGLLVARMGLRFGLLGGAAAYFLGCVICALAPDMSTLLTGRLLQGSGGGGLVALVYVALNRLFPQSLLPRLIAFTSAIWSVSAFCGPLVGGTFASLGHWRLAYWAFALQAVLFAIAVLARFDVAGGELGANRAVVPVARLGLLMAAVLGIAVAGVHIDPVVSPLLCVASVLLLGLFLRVDATCGGTRMFPQRAFAMDGRLGAGLVMVFAASASTMSFLVYGPLFLETLHGISPLAAGYIVALESLGWGAAAVLFHCADELEEPRRIRAGSALVTLGIVGFALTLPGGPLWAVALWAVCQGAGFGVMWGFVLRRIVTAAPAAQRDLASSAFPTIQQIGFAVGAAASGIVANAAGFADTASVSTLHDAAFWVFAAFVPLALFANAAAWRLAR